MKKYISRTKIYICLALIILSTVILPIKAFAIDRDFYAGNDILFFDPDAQSTNCLDSGSDTGDGTLTGKNNKEKIWCYLITVFKLSKGGAAGVVGNMARETGNTFNPDLWQGDTCERLGKDSGYCGYGLYQLSYQKERLWTFVHETPYNTSGKVATVKTQLDFLLKDFKNNASALLAKLQETNISAQDAAFEYLKAYGYYNPDLPRIPCPDNFEQLYADNGEKITQCRGDKYSKEIYQELQNLPCGNPTSASTTVSGAKPKILIGPGHTGSGDEQYSGPSPGIKDAVYGNNPELQDVWDVAKIVKPALEEKGYDVLMTKTNVNDSPFQWDRAQEANFHKVDLAFEIHTDSTHSGGFGDWGYVWSQFKGAYANDKNGNKVDLVASDSVIEKSKAYTAKFAAAREAAGEKNITTGTAPGFYDKEDPKRNTTLVQLWSEVPWIYLEAGADASKDGHAVGGLTEAQKKIYAKGIIDGVVASLPPGTGGTDSNGCNNDNSENDGAVSGDLVNTALNLAWDKSVVIPKDKYTDSYGKSAAKPAYVKAFDKYNGETASAGYTDCGKFVATVVRSSGVDSNYAKAGSFTNQQPYIEAHPEKYREIENLKNTTNLHPGDIFISTSHTFMYVGAAGGAGKVYRQASWGTQPPNAPGYAVSFDGYRIFRAKVYDTSYAGKDNV